MQNCQLFLECCACLRIFNGDISFSSTSTFITLVKFVQTSHQPTCAQSEKTVRRLEIILRSIFIRKWAGIFKNSAKVIAWRSVSFRWHVITYQTKKLFRFSVCILCPLCILQSTFCIWSAASSLTFVLTGIRGTNTIYFWSQLFAQHTQSTTRYLCVSLFDIFVLSFSLILFFPFVRMQTSLTMFQVIHSPPKKYLLYA